VKQPFYFLLAFWGERYRNYFIDRCLPSLLAPNNLPILRASDGHRFVIATTRADRQAIEHLPIFARLREYAEPTFIEMAPPDTETPPGESGTIWQQNVYQKQLVEYAYRSRVYGCLLWPDLIISDGMVAALLRHANAGRSLVLCAALRQVEETVIAELEATGVITLGSRPSMTGQPLHLSPRKVAELSLRHMHPEIRICEEGKPGQPLLTIHRYWPVPGRCGIILHSFLYAPFLMDFSAIERHDTECLSYDKFEDVYVARNFFGRSDIHVVQDSDEFGFVSLTPMGINQVAASNGTHAHWFWDSRIGREWGIRASMILGADIHSDAMKLALFRRPVFWHAEDLDDVWEQKNAEVTAMIESALGDFFRAATKGRRQRIISRNPRHWPVDVYAHYLRSPKKSAGMILFGYALIIARALAGNRHEMTRIYQSIGRRMTRLLGRTS
jgi:hypothetical protein